MADASVPAIRFKRGDTLIRTFTALSGGAFVDLSGSSALFQARHPRLDSILLSASTETGELTLIQVAVDPDTQAVVEVDNGGVYARYRLTVPASITRALVPGVYLADFQITLADQVVTSTVDIHFEVVKDWSRLP